MKKLGLWVFVMGLTLCVGLGTYFYFGSSQAVASLDAHAKVTHSKKVDQAKTKNADFVELQPLILPIIDKYGVSQVVSLVVALEIENKEYTETIIKLGPKLKDAYIQDMYGALNNKAAMSGGVVQVGMIKRRLKKVTDEVLGKNVVTDVLLQVVQQRPI